jgi:hypothetical protein
MRFAALVQPLIQEYRVRDPEYPLAIFYFLHRLLEQLHKRYGGYDLCYA